MVDAGSVSILAAILFHHRRKDTLNFTLQLSVIWGWTITAFFTTLVAMSLAEICSAFPTTGGLYFWVSRLADSSWMPLACWLTGWFNWISYSCKLIQLSYDPITVSTRSRLFTMTMYVLPQSASAALPWVVANSLLESFVFGRVTSACNFKPNILLLFVARQPETDTSVYVQYAIFVGICLLYGIINSVAVKLNGLINQAACK